DQELVEHVGANEAVDLGDSLWNHVHEAIVKLERTDGYFVDPCQVAGSTAFANAFHDLIGQLRGADLVGEFASDGHAGSAGIKEESCRRAVVEGDADAESATFKGHADGQWFQLDISLLHLGIEDPDLASGDGLQQSQVFALVAFEVGIGAELSQVFLQPDGV